MGYKKLSKEQELQLIEEYKKGTPVVELMIKYGYKTKKSITDKIKKYYPDDYKNIIKEARDGRRGYTYSLETITSPFDAYLIGLLLTDGYVLSDRDGLGLDMTDEDVIKFVSEGIHTKYYSYTTENKNHYRILITIPGITKQVERFGIIPNKSHIIPAPNLKDEEKQYLPYIIRGIIDGDGSVAKTSYGGAQFFIVTLSLEFANWIVSVLKNNFFMDDINIRQDNESKIYRIETANQYNILKLIALVYNKPYGMNRKYNNLRRTFRDYNEDALLDKEDGIVQTTTELGLGN